jgi:RNA polymerase sigma factor (sigma-70 family)
MYSRDFSSLKKELISGENRMLRKIFEDHSRSCIDRLTSRFRCCRDDAEDIYVDAILNLRDKIISGEVQMLTDVGAYLFATCRNMYLVRLKQNERTLIAAQEFSRSTDVGAQLMQDDSELEREQFEKVLEDALTKIPENCQVLLRSFYYHRQSLSDIAIKMGLASANVAKVIKSRCFRKLLEGVRTHKLVNLR